MDKTKFFKDVRQYLIQKYNSEHGDKEEDELSPHIKAYRKLIDNFPLPVVVAKIEDKDETPSVVYDLVVYDFHKNNQVTADGGTINFSDKEFEKLLNEHMSRQVTINGLEKNEDTFASPEDGYYIRFFHYDIYKEEDKFKNELFMDIISDFPNMYISEFVDSLDFNSLYSLKPDKVLSEKEIFKSNSPKGILIDDEIVEPTVEYYQQELIHIQLIPNVPEEVKRVFEIAKKLYIFSSIEYHFGMVATHYANLSMESAMKNYYNLWLDEEATIENKKGITTILYGPSMESIEKYVRLNKGWDRYHLKVKGEPYPFSLKKLARWIIKKKKLPRYHIEELERFISGRNWLSHLTHMPIFPGQSWYLENTAYYINLIFHEE